MVLGQYLSGIKQEAVDKINIWQEGYKENMEELRFQDQIICYEIIRSKRKTISIEIKKDQSVLVRSPQNISKNTIRQMVYEKADWIRNGQEEMEKRQENQQRASYQEGELFFYKGKKYTLHIIEDKTLRTPVVAAAGEYLTIRVLKEREALVRDSLLTWYYKKAGETIKERVAWYEGEVERKGRRISIKDQKTRWGSCSSQGNLNFNWRLILVPPPLLDYVVVHELCHFKHMNHSHLFWKEVEAVLPDYGERRKQLKEYEKIIDISF